MITYGFSSSFSFCFHGFQAPLCDMLLVSYIRNNVRNRLWMRLSNQKGIKRTHFCVPAYLKTQIQTWSINGRSVSEREVKSNVLSHIKGDCLEEEQIDCIIIVLIFLTGILLVDKSRVTAGKLFILIWNWKKKKKKIVVIPFMACRCCSTFVMYSST